MMYTICFLLFFSIIGSLVIWIIIEKIVKLYIRKSLEKFKIPRKSIESENLKNQPYLNELTYLALFNGFLELLVYSISIIKGKPEFIVFWLGIKTALRWDRIRNSKNEKPKFKKNHELQKYYDTRTRGIYLSFLCGSALNIIFAFIISLIIESGFVLLCLH